VNTLEALVVGLTTYTACNLGWGLAEGMDFATLMTARRIAPWWLVLTACAVAGPVWTWWQTKRTGRGDR
jgi:hypothetical protein